MHIYMQMRLTTCVIMHIHMEIDHMWSHMHMHETRCEKALQGPFASNFVHVNVHV